MAKLSELSAITAVTDSDLLMITDAETSASKRITWSNVKASIDTIGTVNIEASTNNGGRVNIQQSNDAAGGPNLLFKKSRGAIGSLDAVSNGDTLGKVAAYAYTGSSFVLSGNFGWTADGTDGDSKWELKQKIDGNMTNVLHSEADGTMVCNNFRHSPPASNNPHSNGELTFEATNDTTVTVKYKGSDGVVRSATLTLS